MLPTRYLTHRLSRRSLLRSTLAGGTGLAGAYMLGCGDGGGDEPSPTQVIGPTEPPPPTTPLVPHAWRQIAATGIQPSPRRDHSLVSDGERLFLFGGRSGDGELADLWAYDVAAGTWTELSAAGPVARHGHNAVWHETRARMVLFGGEGEGGFFDDLWEYDPATNAWTEIAADAGPAARYGAGADLDDDGRLLVSHGFTSQGRFADTWQYDFTTGVWSDSTPGDGKQPVERCLMRAIWDPLRGRLLLFGGQTTGTPFLGDLWSLSESGWSELSRSPSPEPRTFYTMVYNHTDRKVVIFGGNTAIGPANDLWELDAQNEFWTALPVDGTPPSPRFGHDGVWTAEAGSVYVFGGNDGERDLNELWELSTI